MATMIVAILGAGCKKADDEDEPAVVPKAVTFEGKVDPSYVGEWKSTDGTSDLHLAKDGTVEIDSTTNSQNGKSTSHIKGMWLVSGERLLFKYAEKSGGDTTLEYNGKPTGNDLTLQQPGGRLKTKYTRK